MTLTDFDRHNYVTTIINRMVSRSPQLWFPQSAVCIRYFNHKQAAIAVINKAIADEFIPLLSKAAANIPPPAAIGPAGPNRTLRMLKDAVSKGAKLLFQQVRNQSEDCNESTNGGANDVEVDHF